MAISNRFRTYPIVGTLNVQYPAFQFSDPSGTYQSPGGVIALTANTTVYVVYTRSTGVVTTTSSVNVPGFIYGDQFVTNATGITSQIPFIQTPIIGGQSGAAAVTAGQVGELLSSLIPTGSKISLTTATPANVTSLTLTPGDWDVWGNINLVAASATVTALTGGINTTSATVPTDGTEIFSGQQATTTSFNGMMSAPQKPVRIIVNTPIYLVASATFSAGTIQAYGAFYARRRS